MNKGLFDLLACPQCGSTDLASGPPSDDFIVSQGTLICLSCSVRYPILNGIPQMLPPHLATALPPKSAYMEKLRAAIAEGNEDRRKANNREIDRFMWERQLYDWGQEVIYKDTKAAEIFSSYAESGARGLCRFLQEMAGGVKGKTLLYVGSGNDRLVTLPLQREGAFIVNLDIVGDCLEDLKQAGAANCVCGDARRLPFRAEGFDVVFSKGSVHHSHPIAEPLRAMVRAVKPGGHIVVAEPNRYALLRLPRRLLPSGLGRPTPYEGAISAGEVIHILAQEGISQFRIADLTYAPPGTPASIASLWGRLGNIMPWLDRFAFEFMVYGRKT